MTAHDTTREATILLVEDDEPLRGVVATILTKAGHRVLAAEDAIEAAELSSSEEPKLDLLIADLTLPGFSGSDLAHEIVDRYPGIKVIFVSGHNDPTVLKTMHLDPGQKFLPKPYSPETIMGAVEEALT